MPDIIFNGSLCGNGIVKSKQKLENGEFETEIAIIQSVFIKRIQRYWIWVRGLIREEAMAIRNTYHHFQSIKAILDET